MKLKTFFAQTLPAGMEKIRAQFGENAVILSLTPIERKGLKIVVATDTQQSSFANDDPFDLKLQNRVSFLSNLLYRHGFDDVFIKRLAQASLRKNSKISDEKILQTAFDELFSFKPLYPILENPIYVLTGNAGSGKTLTAKKMLLKAQSENLKPAFVTLDVFKSGAVDDVKKFSHLTKIPYFVVQTKNEINEVLTMTRLSSNYIVVDTPAINPFKIDDLHYLKNIKQQLLDAHFIFTLPAGLDTQESVAEGALFFKHGCSDLVATKLDCSTRYANLLHTTLQNPFNWSGFSFSNKSVTPLIEASSTSLAQLFSLSKQNT